MNKYKFIKFLIDTIEELDSRVAYDDECLFLIGKLEFAQSLLYDIKEGLFDEKKVLPSCAADPACCTDAQIDHMLDYLSVLDQEGKL